MKTLKIVLLILVILAFFLLPRMSTGITPTDVSVAQSTTSDITPEEMTVEQMIVKVSSQFNQDPLLISKISWCESQHKVVVHDGGHGKGVTGIHKRTFEGWLVLYKKETGETLNYDSTYDQLKMMSWAFSKGDSYRNQWTTYVAYKKGGTYSFYSRLLKGHFTVHCK